MRDIGKMLVKKRVELSKIKLQSDAGSFRRFLAKTPPPSRREALKKRIVREKQVSGNNPLTGSKYSVHGWQANTRRNTTASPVIFRAMPETEIPPAMRVDIYCFIMNDNEFSKKP